MRVLSMTVALVAHSLLASAFENEGLAKALAEGIIPTFLEEFSNKTYKEFDTFKSFAGFLKLSSEHEVRLRSAASSHPFPVETEGEAPLFSDGRTQSETAAANSFVLTSSSLESSSSFTCETLPIGYSPFTFCSGVVDYPFIVEAGSSLADLELATRSALTPFNIFISPECMTDVKRLVCASVYKRCVDNGKLFMVHLI